MLTLLAALSAAASLLACVLVFGMKGKLGAGGNAGAEEALRSLKDKVNDSDKAMRDEFARSRKESADSAKDDREELRKTLASFEKRLDENAKTQQDLLRQQFEDLLKQSHLASNGRVKDARRRSRNTDGDPKTPCALRRCADGGRKTPGHPGEASREFQVGQRAWSWCTKASASQNIASGVGDLKKVLTNVKTKGILGEYQLANIIEQLLPENSAPRMWRHGRVYERVEFAVRMPVIRSRGRPSTPSSLSRATTSSSMPGKLQSEAGPRRRRRWPPHWRSSPKTRKYVEAPYTMDFGVMFLPIESLYAEVLRHPGVFETLQRKYRITVTGPTTMSALLNSLQMGFRTLAVTKQSSEVWKILEAVKTEFGKLTDQLEKVDKQLSTAKKSLEDLRSTRTNVMQRRLKDVGTLDAGESQTLLDMPAASDALTDEA